MGTLAPKPGELRLMSILKGRPDAGQGGKRGHSHMDHWEFTEEIKLAARKRRRHEAKRQISAALKEMANKEDSDLGAVATKKKLATDLRG